MSPEEPLQTLGLSRSSSSESTAPAADDLQFHTAEYEGESENACLHCRKTIDGEFYNLDGRMICPACKAQRDEANAPVRGRKFLKALLYGAGAALAGSALYAIVLLTTGYEIGLLSILVGVTVGKAILRATGGLGGRRLQIAAVILTYGSITCGYIPSIVKGIYDEQKKKPAAEAQANKDTAVAEAVELQPGVGGAVIAVGVALVFVIGLALVSPVLMVASDLSGLISVAIIFFGLQQAWTKTRGDTSVVTGPFTVQQQPAGGMGADAASA